MECFVTLAPRSSSCPCSSAISTNSRSVRSSRASHFCWRRSCRFHALEVQQASSSIRNPRRRRSSSSSRDVELEILRFMQQSEKPNAFPTKEELIAAGRADLVQAAIQRGGWLTLGWEKQQLDKHKPEVVRINGGASDTRDNGYVKLRIRDEEDEQRLARLNAAAETCRKELLPVQDEQRLARLNAAAEACRKDLLPPVQHEGRVQDEERLALNAAAEACRKDLPAEDDSQRLARAGGCRKELLPVQDEQRLDRLKAAAEARRKDLLPAQDEQRLSRLNAAAEAFRREFSAEDEQRLARLNGAAAAGACTTHISPVQDEQLLSRLSAAGEACRKELPTELILKKESSDRRSPTAEEADSVLFDRKEQDHGGDEFTSTTEAAEGRLPSLIRNAGRRRQPRNSTTRQKEKIITSESLPLVEASHERWRRKRRKEGQPAANDNTSVRNALDWVHDMVQRREQWLLESMSKPSKQAARNVTKIDVPTTSTTKRAPAGKFISQITSEPRESNSLSSLLSKEPSSADGNSFNARLRKLGTKLLATRAALKSGRAALLKGEDKLMQVQRKTGEELAKAADSLEFRENDIMQTRAELRRTRAQVTALQAKMALELSEARKATEEKQMLLDRAEKALGMMRLVRIVWPNPASHVLLTGSFDGWTNKIKMEKSSAGVYVTALHLYPGRYEVKFIVDGTWRVDACRPITYADGIENNVLMVS